VLVASLVFQLLWLAVLRVPLVLWLVVSLALSVLLVVGVQPLYFVEVQKTTAGTVAPSLVSAKKYHIIIASVGTEKDAEAMAKQLIEKGYPHAKAIVGDGKMRVSIESCGTETEAYQALNRVRQNETYKNAWVLKK
jgi:hypothetical protein